MERRRNICFFFFFELTRRSSVLHSSDHAVLRDGLLDGDGVAWFLAAGDPVPGGGRGDSDFSVVHALQACRVRCRHVQLMERRPGEERRPRHFHFPRVPIDLENACLVPARDPVRHLAEQPRVQIRGDHPQNCPLNRVVGLQRHVVPSRLEDRTVVVHVGHLHPHDGHGAQTPCNQANTRTIRTDKEKRRLGNGRDERGRDYAYFALLS